MPPMNPYQQLARVALDVMATASIRAGDQELATVSNARSMLRGIAEGQLVVGTPVKEERPARGGKPAAVPTPPPSDPPEDPPTPPLPSPDPAGT